MAILREKLVRRKEREPSTRPLQINALTPEERANVVSALKVLAVRYRDLAGVARELGLRQKLLHTVVRLGNPSAGLAIRVARLAGVPVDDVLTGAFPKPGSCPMCGRS